MNRTVRGNVMVNKWTDRKGQRAVIFSNILTLTSNFAENDILPDIMLEMKLSIIAKATTRVKLASYMACHREYIVPLETFFS